MSILWDGPGGGEGVFDLHIHPIEKERMGNLGIWDFHGDVFIFRKRISNFTFDI